MTYRLTVALLFLGICAFSTALSPATAEAQPRDRCSDYANRMVTQDQRARQMKCPGWTSHSNFNNHYNWCQAQTPQRVQQATANWQSRFQSCEFAASGSPAARADASRCNSYGDEMVRINQAGRQKACRGWNGHSDRAGHIQWCQVQTPERVSQALANWRNRLRAC